MHAAWEAAVRPLNYARDGSDMSGTGAWRQEGEWSYHVTSLMP